MSVLHLWVMFSLLQPKAAARSVEIVEASAVAGQPAFKTKPITERSQGSSCTVPAHSCRPRCICGECNQVYDVFLCTAALAA